MFEFGMSALVLKICQEYAQATGLNFPPCVQQELNAVAQWVAKHTVKDLDITQDGNIVTFKFTEDKDTPTVFTIELPEEYVLNVDDLYNLIKGSSSVVVDKSSDGKTLVVRLDKSQEVQYITLSPDSATQGTLTVEQFTALQLNKGNCIILNNEIYRLADNQHTTGVISYVHTGWDSNIVNKSINITVSTRAWTMVKAESSGGVKLYRHVVEATLLNTVNDKDMEVTFIYYRNDTKSFKTAFNNGDYTSIKDLKYASILLTYYRPDDSQPPCQGIGMLNDLSSSGSTSPTISSDSFYGVVYSMSGDYYFSLSYPVHIKSVKTEYITEV